MTTICPRISSLPRLLIATVGVLVGFAAFSSAAHACSYPDAEQVFASWQDEGYYQLAPDGGLEEGGNGWTFTGGAELVNGNESQFLNSPEDQVALKLPYGATATSPRVCIDENTPEFRLMALNAGSAQSHLRVSVEIDLGRQDTTRNAEVKASDEWEPTREVRLDTNTSTERVARISFTPKDDLGEWLIDDLYIDPWARR